MPDDLHASTPTADPVTDSNVAGPPIVATTKEYICQRCAHVWNRHRSAPADLAHRPRACPSCHSAYWDRPPQQPHASRPSADPTADHARRQDSARLSRQKTQLRRMLHDIGAAHAASVIAEMPLVMAELRPPASLIATATVPAPAPTPVDIRITVQHEEPRYPWQGHGSRLDLDLAAPSLIPPPPSVATLPEFVSVGLPVSPGITAAEPSPEQIVARREL